MIHLHLESIYDLLEAWKVLGALLETVLFGNMGSSLVIHLSDTARHFAMYCLFWPTYTYARGNLSRKYGASTDFGEFFQEKIRNHSSFLNMPNLLYHWLEFEDIALLQIICLIWDFQSGKERRLKWGTRLYTNTPLVLIWQIASVIGRFHK